MNWYPLMVVPSLEFRAEAAIRRQGVDVVAPFEMQELRAQYSKSKGIVPPARFRRIAILRQYMFVKLPHGDAIGGLMQAVQDQEHRRLIIRALGAYGQPMAVPRHAFAHLEALSGLQVRLATTDPLKPGDRVRIVDGHAYAGTLTEIKTIRRNAARVLLQVIGSMKEVEIGIKHLQRVDRSAQNSVAA